MAYDVQHDQWREVHRDVLDINAANQRRRFATEVAERMNCPVCDVEAALLAATAQSGPHDVRPGVGGEAPDDPHRLALLCLEEWSDTERQQGLIYYRDDYYAFDASKYHVVGIKDVQARVTAAIKREFNRLGRAGLLAPNGHIFKVTSKLLNDVVRVIESLTKISDARSLPMWRDDRPDMVPLPENVLVTPSGLVDLAALAAGHFQWIPPTPAFISTHGIGFSVEPAAQCPCWENFLRQLWPDDQDSIHLLQEWFGYLLLPDTSQQKMLMLCGPTRSGKGTIGRVLNSFLGEANVAGPTLRRMQGEFGLEPLINKSLALVSDARLSGKIDAMSLLEDILNITGEDTMTINRKNKPMLTLRLPTRIMISCNEFPRFQDASQALFSRLLLLQLRHTWLNQEDHDLTARLIGELPGILNWSIAGLGRLRQRGRFVQPSSSQQFLDECRRMVSPVHAFIQDRLEVGHEFSVPTQTCFQEWIRWRNDNGVQVLSEQQTFGRSLHSALPFLTVGQSTIHNGRQREYRGIRIRNRPN
ncbi:MAG TPA: phage/plasmid primase, P4 family [Schlesneria sp.]